MADVEAVMRSRPLLVATLLAALAGACGSGDAGGREIRSRSSAPPPPNVGSPSSTVPPPPETGSPISLWLSGERVPRGVELVVILVNHTGVDVTFGVAAAVDRWDGSEWAPYRRLTMCLDHWHCTGEMHPLDGELAVRDIGLVAEVGSPGPVERFTTDGLAPGWYRVTQVANDEIAAAGIFEVTDEGATPAPLVPLDAAAISVRPALVPADGADGTEVVLTPLIPAFGGAQSITDVEQAVDGLAETATIERPGSARKEGSVP